jgi:hypothetical protein
VERWLRIRENGHGEWSVLDVERNYRVCSFNDASHGGSHVHDRDRTHRVSVPGLDAAKQIVRAYAKKHATFKIGEFEAEVKRWKSRPNRG